jgi:hypothetical protein
MRVWLQRGERLKGDSGQTAEMVLLSCPEADVLEGVRATPELLHLFEQSDRGWFEAARIPGGWDVRRRRDAVLS